MSKIASFIFLFIFCALFLVKAQNVERNFLFGVGSNAYSGELSSFNSMGLSLDFGLEFSGEKKINSGLYAGFGSFSGENNNYTGTAPSVEVQKYFKTSFFYLNYAARYIIIDKDKFKAYAGIGAGIFYFVPKDQFNQNLQDRPETRPVGQEYSSITIAFPLTLGIQYYLAQNAGLKINVDLKNPMSSYLDNISEQSNDQVLTLKVLFFKTI